MKRKPVLGITPWVLRCFGVALLLAMGLPSESLSQTPTFNPSAPSTATNSAPGATYSRVFQFSPSNSTFTAVTLSGAGIVPSGNITLSVSGQTNLTATVQPLTNQSGTATFRITGVTPGNTSTNTVEFSVVFRPYPPRFVPPLPPVTMAEDTTNVVNFVLQDADTPLNDLVLTRSSSNPGLIDDTGLTFGGSGSNRTLTLIPNRDINGSAVITLTVSDGDYLVTTNFNLTVTPVPDPSTITGAVNRAFGDDVGITNVFSSVTIDDVDHNMPTNELLVVTVTLGSDQLLRFPGNATTYTTTAIPEQVTTAIRNLGVIPERYRGPPNTINNESATIRVRGLVDNITVTNTVNLSITVINSPPIFEMLVSPTSVVEGQSIQPFRIDYISDPDIGDDIFGVLLEIANPAQTNLGTFNPGNFLQDNRTGLDAALQSLVFTATTGIITNPSVDVPIRFTLTDGFGGSSVRTNVLTILQVQNPPSITGIPTDPIIKTDGSPPFSPLPTVFVSDVDQGGAQQVSATLSLSAPSLGSLSATNFSLQNQSDLIAALRQVAFTPTPGALPINQTADTVITLTVTDALGLSSQNNNARISITSVNNAPVILNVPPLSAQPVLIPPVDPLYPFLALGLTNDDTNNVLFTVSIDNPDKGTIGNLGGFAIVSNGVYQMSGQVPAILSSLTNLSFTVNPSFLFPVDDPGGTTFTLSARDFALLTTTRTLYIQIQAEPRNHLVTRVQNDGLPGSFLYALQQAGNSDVITFALPGYPALIRMPGTTANNIIRNVTIKGPGANLLTISGDNNGDGQPNRRLFRISASVTMEGLTLSHGTAAYGGAVLVHNNGNLILRQVAVVDSVATDYGGAIDVDGGALTLDGCFIGRNTLAPDTGMSGAGVSVYSDREIRISNTTFADNHQQNESGDGGGALVVENLNAGTQQNTLVTHATFAENTDAAGRASAMLSVSAGTRIRPAYSIFADFSGRNLDVSGTGRIVSRGGNLCDDSTRTILSQQGGTEDVFLLDHPNDSTTVNPLLAPLNLSGNPTPFYAPLSGSVAINKAVGSTNSIDQRGVLRVGTPDSGAIEFNALQRLVINEISFNAAHPAFVEIYVRRDSTPINLSAYSLFVDGVNVHNFAASTIIGTNAIYPTAGASANMLLNPGFGVVVAFTNTPIGITSPNNVTPVVGASNLGSFTGLRERGLITIAVNADLQPIARQSYLGVYLNPADGSNVLNIAANSISLAPQFLGYALVPHGFILPGPFSGFNPGADPTSNQRSPGGDSSGTPFGQDNAEPLALPDIFTVTEDDFASLDVLANDFDGDGNDRLVIVDVSTTSTPGSGDNSGGTSELGAIVSVVPAATPLRGESIQFDPRNAPVLQALPVGVEIIDTFYYEIIDIGSAPVGLYASSNTATAISSLNHRLVTGDEIRITDAVPAVYNGVHMVTVSNDDVFTIPVTFAGNTGTNGIWETIAPRSPTTRSEASVSIRVIGVNDAPVAVLDVITNVTELTTMRIMTRPALAGQVLVFPEDPLPAPVPSSQDLLSNDFDIDTDDTWETLRVVGVLGEVNLITGYSGSPGQTPVTVHAPQHGLASGAEVLIANYGGHPSYNAYHVITIIDDDSFTIPRFFVDNHPDKGVWVILNDGNRYNAVTDVEATVSLTLRADQNEDHLLYDASASFFLRGLAEDELYTNRFFYAVVDTHGAIGIGPIDVIVIGLNDPPIILPDPDSLGVLDPLLDENTTLEDLLSGDGLDLMYVLPPISGGSGRTDLHLLDLSGVLPGTLVLRDFFVTDEDTPLDIDADDLLANDTDIDRIDILTIISVDSLSREGAALSLSAGVITFDPTVSSNLQALAREELLIDTFSVVVSDGGIGGTITSLVAVLVVGLNDTPVANPLDYSIDFTADYTTDEDSVWSIALGTLIDRAHAIELDVNQVVPDDRLRFIPDANAANPGDALVVITDSNIVHDATVSDYLNGMSVTHTFTNVFDYTIIDNSFLFATDDSFYVPLNATDVLLDVLANDRDFTDAEGLIAIISAGPALHGGVVTVAPDGLALIYSSPVDFVGDDYFRYIIENDKGDRNAGLVMVRSVVPPLNGVLSAADDAFTVAAGETATLNVLVNDNMLPGTGAGLTLLEVISSSQPGQPVLISNTLIYTATNGLAPLTFRYAVSAGGTAIASAEAVVNIVERRGTLNIQDDSFSVLPGSFDNELNVLINDNIVNQSIANLRIQSVVDPAANGTVSIHPDQTRLLYTPDSGFIGIETFQYIATDQIGGTGTGTVVVKVGRIEVASDFFTVRAETGGSPVTLDVLSNDRLFPQTGGDLTIVSVDPATPTAIGTLAVSGGTSLTFTATATIGQVDFNYVVQDVSMPARTATGRVTIATVANGVYANPDRYIVRGGGANYEFDVLANDISFPDVNKIYSILSIGVGPDAPDQGGFVTILDNKLSYTPAPGFFGEESFTYTMSDSLVTDVARVTVSVRRGDLVANDDAYTVFYEIPAGTNVATSFVLPVILNDRIQPSFDQVMTISSLGIGANLPDQGGSVSIAPNGLSLIYRPVAVPGPEYIEQFTYEISDGGDRRALATVRVRVKNRESNLIALTQDDAFTVARNSVTNRLSVLANDFVLPGSAAGWTITGVSTSTFGGSLSIQGARVLYTAPMDFVGIDTFTYAVNDGLGGTGEATVRVKVGELPVLESLFTVLSGTFDNELDVLANDVLDPAYADEYTLFAGPFSGSEGGSAAVSGNNTLLYTPNLAYAGGYPYQETLNYLVSDDAAGVVTGTVRIIVHETGSDRSSSTITLLVEGRDDPAIINPDPDSLSKLQPIVDATATPLEDILANGLDIQYLLPPTSGDPDLIDLHVVDLSGTVPGVIDLTDFYFTDEKTSYLIISTNLIANDIEIDRGDFLDIVAIDAQSREQAGLITTTLGDVITTITYDPNVSTNLQSLSREEMVIDTFNVVVRELRPDASFSLYTSVVAVLVIGLNDTPIALPITDTTDEDSVWERTYAEMISDATIVEVDINAVVPDDRFVIVAVSDLANPGDALINMTATGGIVHDATVSELLNQLADWQSFTNLFEYTVTDNSFLFAVNDEYHVAPGATRELEVLENDRDWTDAQGDLTILSVGPTFQGATVSIRGDGKAVIYTAAPDFAGFDSFRYIIQNDLGDQRQARVIIQADDTIVVASDFVALSDAVDEPLEVTANDNLPAAYALIDAFGADAGGSVSVSAGRVLYTPAAALVYPYVETFRYVVSDGVHPEVTGTVRVAVHEVGSDRATATITLIVQGINDPPEMENPAVNAPITDKSVSQLFLPVTITEVDQQLMEPLDIEVFLDDGDKGILIQTGPFVDMGGGIYRANGITAAAATAAIRQFLFVPTENRIPVPGTEITYFTITVTDNKSPLLVNTNTFIEVTAINDPPLISGTMADQEFYYRSTIQPFIAVTVTEVDDLTLQPLALVVDVLPASGGVLSNLGAFVFSGSGTYTATGITAQVATDSLRDMVFSVGNNNVLPGESLLTRFRITVNDGFAPSVIDSNTTVIARNAFESTLRPTNLLYQASYGSAVDILPDLALVGAPSATVHGPNSGLAILYQRVPNATNAWQPWIEFAPSSTTTNDRFGRSVVLTEERIAIGATGTAATNGVRQGSVYLFDRDEGGPDAWGNIVHIVPTNLNEGASFGWSVALQGDLLAVGAPEARLNGTGVTVGAVMLFDRNAGGPNAWGEIMRWSPTNAGNVEARFGFSVDLSGDSLVVGAQQFNANLINADREGAVFHFLRDEGSPDAWGLSQFIISPQTNASREFGWSLSVDDNTLLVGAPGMTISNVTRAGRVYHYEKLDGSNTFSYVGALDRHTTNERLFGVSVSVFGNQMIVGAPENKTGANIGAAYYFTRPAAGSTNWTQVERILRPTGVPAGFFGFAVSFNQDIAIVGAPSDLSSINSPNNRGYAFIYRFGGNRAPMPSGTIPNQFGDAGDPFSYTLPAGLFVDPDPDDDLILSVAFPDGANGLDFTNGVFSGTPVDEGAFEVVVTATDPYGATASLSFFIFVGIPEPMTARDQWNFSRFGTARFDPSLESTLWGGNADPDDDGRNNDEEYAFGTDPNYPDADLSRLIIEPFNSTLNTFTYFRRWNDPGLTFYLEATTDMITWHNWGPWILTETTFKIDDEIEFVTLQVIILNTQNLMGFRVRVAM